MYYCSFLVWNEGVRKKARKGNEGVIETVELSTSPTVNESRDARYFGVVERVVARFEYPRRRLCRD